MNYRDAMLLGKEAFGIVKCTYAIFYNKDYRKLFVMSGSDTQYERSSIIDYGNGEMEQIFRLPIVRATEFKETKGWNKPIVPVHITEEAISVISDKLADAMPRFENGRDYVFWKEPTNDAYWQKTIKWRKDYNGHKAGDFDIIEEVHEAPDEKTIREWQAQSNEYQKNEWYRIQHDTTTSYTYGELFDKIAEDGAVYVRPDAIEWYPTEIVSTFIDEDNMYKSIDVEIDKVKADLSAARRLIVMAGGATLL